MSNGLIEDFLLLLKKSPGGAAFNPWWQIDRENDINRRAPKIRREQLAAYLELRLKTARVAIIGEAVGYRGGHFTGIAMTSERILLGRNPRVDVDPSEIVRGGSARRTSKPAICRDGFSEPTATIVWSSLLKLGLRPRDCVLWNAFPWHSFDSRRGPLSNRMPNKRERAAGLPVLQKFLELFRFEQVIALGRIAQEHLGEIGIDAKCARHPASGGAKLFREQIAEIVARLS